MNWDALGALGEIVGAIAVVITLAFLIYQLRQHTAALQQQSERASAQAIHEWSRLMMDPTISQNVTSVYVDDGEPKTLAQKSSAEHTAFSLLIILQQDYLDRNRGYQTRTVWDSRVRLIEAVFVSRHVRSWWKEMGNTYLVPDFQGCSTKNCGCRG